MLKLKQRSRVLRPALLDVFADAGGFVGQHFQPAQRGMQEGPLAFEHARHVRRPTAWCTSRMRRRTERFVEFRR